MTWPFMLKRTHKKVVGAYEVRLDAAIQAIVKQPDNDKEAN